MKKIFKLFPVALAAFALASCSNENDYFAEDGTINAPEGSIIATVEDAHYEGGGVTRSALADFADGKYERVVWTDGDAFKLYARCNWRTDKFELTAAGMNNTVGVFQCANEDGESHILAKDSAYAVFPYSVTVDDDGKIDAENGDVTVTQMQDEERTKLDIFLPAAWTPKKITAKKAATDVTTEAYTCPIPLWGFAWQNSNGTKDIKFKYLTAVLCVNVGIIPSGAEAIVVEAADLGGGAQPIDVIAGAFEADVKDLMLSVWNKDIETEAEVDVKNVPDLYPSTNPNATKKNKIIVTLPTGVANKSLFYIPVPAGKYHNLNVYLGKANGDMLDTPNDTYLRQFGHFAKDEQGKYTATVAADGTVEGYYEELKVKYFYDVNPNGAVSANIPENTFKDENATIAKLNEYLQNLDYDADIDITVNDQLTSQVTVINKETVNDTLLVIPASTHKVNITFAKGLVTENKTTGKTKRPLAIKNQGATLTIAGGAGEDKVIKYVDVIGESTGTVVIGKNIATNGAFKTWSPAAVDVNAEGSTIAELDVNNASAAVTLTKGTVTALNVNAGTATIGSETKANTAGAATNVVLTTGTFNVNNLGYTDPVNVTFKGAGTLNLWDGTVTTIYADASLQPASSGSPAKYTGVGKATVNTFYNAVIGKVTKTGGNTNDAGAIAKINFYANWAKANATGTGATAQKTAAATIEVADIFTASQFAAISNANSITGYKLHTNIDFDGYTGTGLALNKSLVGDTVTIQKFKVATTGADQKLGLFSTVTPAADMEISHLTVQDVTADLKKGDNNVYTLADAIGGVIGQVASSSHTLTLKDVHLKGTNTLGVNASTQSANIGGLIGEAAGNVVLDNTSVEGLTINGYHSLGGLIGAASANVTISDANTKVSSLTINVKYSDDNADQDQNFGKVGGFIGTANLTKTITIGAASSNAIAAPSFTLTGGQFAKNWFVATKTTGAFFQYYHSGQNYIGYSTGITLPTAESSYNEGVWSPTGLGTIKINNASKTVKCLSASAPANTSTTNCLFYFNTAKE